MWRDAINEIRLRPGRFAATFLAIAISVAFLVAVSVFTTTEARALGMSSGLAFSKADVVVTDFYDDESTLRAIEDADGVREVAPMPASYPSILTLGDLSANATLYATPPESFRWAEISEGRYPETAEEVALASAAADELGAEVGDTIETYSGSATVVGITDDARSLFFNTAYVGESESDYVQGFVILADGDPQDVVRNIERALLAAQTDGVVQTADDHRDETVDQLMSDFDVFGAIAQGFGGIAMLVGAIIIANTFTILLTQRRRQVALLRAVGASTGQVVGRLVAEGFFVGLLGSLGGVAAGIGVAALGATVTGSIFWGLHIEYARLVWPVLAGTAITLIASLAPSISAAAVKPLEALQSVPSPKAAKRIGVVRLVVCVLFLIVGVLCFLQSRDGDLAIVWAIGAGAAFSITVLAGAPFYVAPLIKLMGRIFGGISPTIRLALQNAARNPRRASATAVALMLAVGLTVTLQVGVATARESGQAAINEQYPVDIAVGVDQYEDPEGEIPPELVADLEGLEAVDSVVVIPTKLVEGEYTTYSVIDRSGAREQLGLDPEDIPDGEAWTSWASEDSILVPTDSGDVELAVKAHDGVVSDDYVVSRATYEGIQAEETDRQIWLQVRDRSSVTDLNVIVSVVERYDEIRLLDSGAQIAAMFEQVLDIVMIVLTALLGVAVVIALVGVGNTLGLSVIERQRESALLRALGMQRAGLRTMLLIEAMALMLVGVLVGVAAGAFFGWLGVTSVVAMMPNPDEFPIRFAIDPWYTLGLIAICALAAALASILPGRRAARATPTEALAVD